MDQQVSTRAGSEDVVREVMRQLLVIRKKWNMTREDLAELSGVCLRTISEMERSTRPHDTSISTLCNLANALGCDLVIGVKFRSTGG